MTTYYVAKYTPTLAYCFDGTVSDPDTAWTNDANIADCDTATVASTSTTGGSTSNYIQIVGNAAPTSGGTITDVWVRAYVSDSSDTTGGYEVRTSGWGQSLSTGSFGLVSTGHPSDWHFWKKLTTPTGGWTWQKISDLEIRVWISIAGTFYIAQVQVGVNIGLSKENPYYHMTDAEDTPVAANDTVYVGPGTYRERLIVDVSGSSGNPITYIGDVTGEHTNGIGGVVRITGSDDDVTTSRLHGIYSSTARSYRTFRGFSIDFCTVAQIYMTETDNVIIEDCFLGETVSEGDYGIFVSGMTTGQLLTIRRCIFGSAYSGVYLLDNTTEAVLNSSSVIENCIFLTAGRINGYGVNSSRVSGFTVRNCYFSGVYTGVGGQITTTGTVTVNNSIFRNTRYGISALGGSLISEDYNTFYSNTTNTNGTSGGTNSIVNAPLEEMPMLVAGRYIAWLPQALSQWSQIRAITGTSAPSEDAFGIGRPSTAAKNSWGPIQYHPKSRETTTTYGSSTASLAFADAARHQIFVPVKPYSTIISVYVYRETNYAGTLPQMVIKEPGQADRTTVDTGSTSQWNLLIDTFTPQSTSRFVVVELVSNNTATSGSYVVYFDSLEAKLEI